MWLEAQRASDKLSSMRAAVDKLFFKHSLVNRSKSVFRYELWTRYLNTSGVWNGLRGGWRIAIGRTAYPLRRLLVALKQLLKLRISRPYQVFSPCLTPLIILTHFSFMCKLGRLTFHILQNIEFLRIAHVWLYIFTNGIKKTQNPLTCLKNIIQYPTSLLYAFYVSHIALRLKFLFLLRKAYSKNLKLPSGKRYASQKAH